MKRTVTLCLWIFLFLIASSFSIGPSSQTGFAASSAIEPQGFGRPAFSCFGNKMNPSPPTDTTPPDTSIDSYPQSPTNSTTANFSFSSNETESSFECQMDKSAWASCTYPKAYTAVSNGIHTFKVRAWDASGNVDPTPASYSWQVGSPDEGMVFIPAGCFDMGDALSEGESIERPVHNVCISAFQMSIYETTNVQYKACVDAGICVPPTGHASWTRDLYFGNPTYDNYPVIFMLWDYASQYCQWAGKRLPTEAEWEYAARGGLSGKRYAWGDTISCYDANYARGPSNCICTDYAGLDNDTHQVGSYSPNGYGLYDMTGNVSESVNDFWDPAYYFLSPTNDPPGPSSGASHVARGGSWIDFWGRKTWDQRVSHRAEEEGMEVIEFGGHGFRCAK